MNFTRDPIIETVITPREGCKLVVRNSKVTNQESFLVDALEVVSFGQSLFFRSQERPRSFLVPVSDYEITESKEAKMVLKTTTADQSIKIGGGREVRPVREESSEEERAPESIDRKRDNKRRRGRRGRDRNDYVAHEAPKETLAPVEASLPDLEQPEEPKEKVSFISKLFPPPPTLIKETIGRYKTPDPAPEDFPTEDFESGQGHTPEEETTDEQ